MSAVAIWLAHTMRDRACGLEEAIPLVSMIHDAPTTADFLEAVFYANTAERDAQLAEARFDALTARVKDRMLTLPDVERALFNSAFALSVNHDPAVAVALANLVKQLPLNEAFANDLATAVARGKHWCLPALALTARRLSPKRVAKALSPGTALAVYRTLIAPLDGGAQMVYQNIARSMVSSLTWSNFAVALDARAAPGAGIAR